MAIVAPKPSCSSSSLLQALAQTFEFPGDGAIHDLIPDLDHQPAEDGGIHAERYGLRADSGEDIFLDGFLLRRTERQGAGDFRYIAFQTGVIQDYNFAGLQS